MLHNLIGPHRRAIIGFGRGAARREFKQLGRDMNQSRDRMSGGVQIIRKAIAEKSLSFHGKHYDFDRVTMRPRPRDAQQLLDDMSYAWGSPTPAAVGARLVLKPLIIPQKAWSEYHQDIADFQHARSEMGFGAVRPRIHMAAYCGETKEDAERVVRQYPPQYTDSDYELHSKHFQNVSGYEHYVKTAAETGSRESMASKPSETYINNHLWGTPEQRIRKLQQVASDFHPEEFMLVVRFGNMPKDVAAKSVALFAKEVLPAVHEIKLHEPIGYEQAA